MSPTPGRRPWLALAGCSLIAVGFNAYLVAPASLIPLLVAEFGIDKPAAGLSISAVYASWLLLQLPGGLLMDRYDNRWLIAGGAVVFAAASGLAVLAPGYAAFLATRVGGGIGAVFVWTACANVVSRVFPPERRALGTSIYVGSAPVGFAIAQFAGPRVAAVYGWRAAFLAYPVASLVGLAVLLAAVRRPVRNETRLDAAGFVAAVRNRGVLFASLASACAASLILFYNAWMPTYATEVLGIDLAAAGAAASLVPLAGVVTRPGGGWLSDRIGRRRPVALAAFLVSVPVPVVVGAVSGFGGFAALLAVAGGFSQLGVGVLLVQASELADPEARGTSIALLTTLWVGGAVVTPTLSGWIVEAGSWTAGFGFAAAVAVLGAAVVFLSPEP